jgi:hypothetical protein
MPHPLPLPVHLRQRLFRTRLSHAIHIRLAKAEQNPGIPRFYTHGDNLSQSFHEAVEEEARRIIGLDKGEQDETRLYWGEYEKKLTDFLEANRRHSTLPVA